jgi:hypothetical protein
MFYFLRYDNDYLDAALKFAYKKNAINHFRNTAEDLSRYEQHVEATLHIANFRDELVEYPDFVLTLGPRGGVRCEKA